MDHSYFDYKRALSSLQTFNQIVLGHKSLNELFVYQGYDLLTVFQTSIFSDFKSRTKFGSVVVLPKFSLFNFVKSFLVFLFVLVVTFFGTFWLIVSRKKVLIFTGDKVSSKSGRHDFRLDPLYEALAEPQESFLEIVHTIPSRESLINFFKRRRLVIYLEAFDWFSSLFVFLKQRRVKKLLGEEFFQTFESDEREFARELIIKYASATEIFKVRLTWLKLVLRLSGVESIFSIDDVRHYNELVLASKLSGVKFTAIQHGHFTKYHVGWLKMFESEYKIIKPDKLIVWSEYWRGGLLKLGTYYDPDEIVVGGAKDHLTPSESSSATGEKIGILLPYETDAPMEDMRKYVEIITRNPKFELIFKLRADLPDELQLSQYGLAAKGVNFTSTHSSRDVLPRVNLVLGTYSTFLYDMVAERKPIGILETSIDYGEGMVLGGLAEGVGLATLEEDLNRLSQTSLEELEERRLRLVGRSNKLLKDYLKHEIQDAVLG